MNELVSLYDMRTDLASRSQAPYVYNMLNYCAF